MVDPIKIHTGIGLMSGSSLDGLDIALCKFVLDNETQLVNHWELLKAETVPYPPVWEDRLKQLTKASAYQLAEAHANLGYLWSQMIATFLEDTPQSPDYIASHGHTIFHYPESRFTTQIGDGATMAFHCEIPVITDFRSTDVAAGGQGAPLAPFADLHLFKGSQLFLNLGGISNISAHTNKGWIAFDIAPANQMLNFLANQIGFSFDPEGKYARKGHLQPALMTQLSANSYFQKPPPKSLDNTWVQAEIIPIIDRFECTVEDKLHTSCVFIARQIANAISFLELGQNGMQLLVTGGGALNHFLIECLENALPNNIQLSLPDLQIIQYKEAILMALLGAYRLEGWPNTLGTVTGASGNTVGGAIYWGAKHPKESDNE